MKETQKGALLIIAAMLIFASMGIFVRFLNLPSHIIVFFSFFITSILLFVYILIKGRKMLNAKKYLFILILLAISNVLNNYFFFQAFITTTISNAVLTHYTAPVFVAILAPFLLKEKIEKMTLAALAVSIIGLIFISYHNFSFHSSDLAGIAYGTISGLMYAFVIILVKKLSSYLSSYTINMYQSFAGALLLVPFAIKAAPISPKSFALLVLFALIFGVTATLLHISGIRKVKSQHAGVLAYIEPIAASFYAFIFFSEIPAFTTIIGGILILFGGYLIIRK